MYLSGGAEESPGCSSVTYRRVPPPSTVISARSSERQPSSSGKSRSILNSDATSDKCRDWTRRCSRLK
jgi:hypothetical protein